MATVTALRAGLEEKDDAGAPSGAPERPHICFVAPYLWPVFSRDAVAKVVGGAEVQQAVLARLFRRHGHRVSIVCQDFGQPPVTELDGITAYRTFREEAGIPVLRFLHPRLTSVWQALHAADADIYYIRSTSMWTGVVAEFCRRYGRRSIYAGASDNDFKRGQEQIRFQRDRWIFAHGLDRIDRIVVQNRQQEEDCLRHYGCESVLIPSCYELPATSQPADVDPAKPGRGDLVIWVGTIHTYKRPELLLEIARRLPHRRFVMVGGSATPGERMRNGYYESVRDAAAALPNVEFKGFLPLAEVEPWFDRARLLVNTSVFEGMPNTFLQAWARGVPTIATVEVGARLKDEPIGRFVVDAEHAADEIEKLLTDDLHWARTSARAREYFASTHSTAEVLARYERIFEELKPKAEE